MGSPRNVLYSILSGIFVFLAFERFNWIPSILLFPFFFNRLSRQSKSPQQAFLFGFITSFTIMVGGFYWVINVLHDFGNIPWSICILLFLCFCGFGCLNFPITCSVFSYLFRRLNFSARPTGPTWPKWKEVFFYTLFLPSLFTVIEYFVPKLFPWYIGHCLYKQTWLIQIVDLTGCTALSFLLYSLGSSLDYTLQFKTLRGWFFSLPLLFIFIFYSHQQIAKNRGETVVLKTAVIQANIGSLDKFLANHGVASAIEKTLEIYKTQTEKILNQKPDLVVWPETAMPFGFNGHNKRSLEIKHWLLKNQITLLTGAYAESLKDYGREYNAAFLLSPMGPNELDVQVYYKNILLAFGEYLPLGEFFPSLYRQFPTVADFLRGTEQKPVTLQNGVRLGINICYEAIIPSFYRKATLHEVNAVVNLTNDSWFAQTSEPYLHGSLAVFRAIESRVPLIRSTNTGISFVVDTMGNISETTPRYLPANLVVDVVIPKVAPPPTIYTLFGDWFILPLLLFSLLFWLWGRGLDRVSISD